MSLVAPRSAPPDAVSAEGHCFRQSAFLIESSWFRSSLFRGAPEPSRLIAAYSSGFWRDAPSGALSATSTTATARQGSLARMSCEGVDDSRLEGSQ